jgi:histidine kinase/DNA gyrase B/HSP90-like ATPase
VSLPAVREGRYTYTRRAFGQDSAEALGRDLVRGIIELVTNSDDAYARLGIRGKVWIGVEHTRGRDTYPLIVRDRAGGMRLDEMRTALTNIGERTSEFESGAAVRGNRGRGAKDLAGFGEAIFESIKDGRYSKVTLRRDGWEAERERDATREERKRLHILRGGGTQVTVHVERSVRCPRHDRLVRAIAHDFQLRDIMADPGREVRLAKLGDQSTPTERLRYAVDREALPDLFDQLYRDHADWTSRILPRIQRIVLRGPGLRVARPVEMN